MLVDKLMLVDASEEPLVHPYFELTYTPGLLYITLSIKDYAGFVYMVNYNAGTVKEAKELYEAGVKWLENRSKNINGDDIGMWIFPILNGFQPQFAYC